MEHAIRIRGTNPTSEKLVSISNERNDGDEIIRNRVYCCPDYKCRVPVYPALPDPNKRGRKAVPRAYFRAGKGHSHVDGCIRDTGIFLEKTSVVTERPWRHLDAEATSKEIPVRFDLRRNRLQPNGVGKQTPKCLPVMLEGDGLAQGGKGIRVSEAGSSLIRSFVAAYEDPAKDTDNARIKIPGCKARHYPEAFCPAFEGIF